MISADPDRETLSAIFASRVTLAKQTEDEAAIEARLDWQKNQKWIASPSIKPGSFLWMCDEFDVEASAVRRAITEKRK